MVGPRGADKPLGREGRCAPWQLVRFFSWTDCACPAELQAEKRGMGAASWGQVGGARAATGAREWLRIRLPALQDVEWPAEGRAGLLIALGRSRGSETPERTFPLGHRRGEA